MGILGKMFDKKVCDICGGDIGLQGDNRFRPVELSLQQGPSGEQLRGQDRFAVPHGEAPRIDAKGLFHFHAQVYGLAAAGA